MCTSCDGGNTSDRTLSSACHTCAGKTHDSLKQRSRANQELVKSMGLGLLCGELLCGAKYKTSALISSFLSSDLYANRSYLAPALYSAQAACCSAPALLSGPVPPRRSVRMRSAPDSGSIKGTAWLTSTLRCTPRSRARHVSRVNAAHMSAVCWSSV